MRCASSSLFSFSKYWICSRNSFRMVFMAVFILSVCVTNCLPGKIVIDSRDSVIFPVSGSNRCIRSISSPKNSILMPSSVWAGRISTVSPRTRKSLRSNAMSFLEYCRSTSLASNGSLPIFMPFMSGIIKAS